MGHKPIHGFIGLLEYNVEEQSLKIQSLTKQRIAAFKLWLNNKNRTVPRLTDLAILAAKSRLSRRDKLSWALNEVPLKRKPYVGIHYKLMSINIA